MMIPFAALLLPACNHSGSNQGTIAANAVSPSSNAAPVVSGSAPVQSAPVDAKDFQSFWSRFRRAALAGDAATLALLSAPAVTGHGELDDDASKKLAPAQTAAAIAKLMADQTPLDGAGHTQRALFESKSTIAAGDLDSPGQERIGNFVFKSGKTGWRLTDLYLGDD